MVKFSRYLGWQEPEFTKSDQTLLGEFGKRKNNQFIKISRFDSHYYHCHCNLFSKVFVDKILNS